MNNKTPKLAVCVLVCLASAGAALAQQGAAEVRGLIQDSEGNPLPGISITFVNPAAPDTEYTAKTNKKGRYYLANLLYYPNSLEWSVSVDSGDLVPTHVNVESRTQAALVDKFESELPPGADVPKLRIRAFGKVVYDVTLTAPDKLAARPATPAEPSAEQPVAVQPKARQAGTPSDPWAAAVQAANLGNLEASVPLFDKAIEQAPDDAERHTALAKVLYQLERYGDAARRAMEATRRAPDSLDAQMVLYSVYVATNNMAGATATLERAREIAPEDLRVLKQLAFVAEQSGDADQALAAHEEIVRLEPGNAESWVALGALHAEAGRLDRSQAAYQKVAEIDPDNAYQVFFNIGALIMNRPNLSAADQKRAVDAFRRAVEIKPDYAQAHQQLAFALLGTGDLEGAGRSIRRYLELDPKAADAADMRALLQGLPK